MSKSKNYQYLFIEIGIEADKLSQFANEDGLAFVNAEIDEEIQECQAELIKTIRKIINKDMTPHQTTILNLMLDDKTQSEIGRELGISQTAVHKAIHGNLDYLNKDENGKPRRYGGAVAKLKKICASDPRVQKWLAEIARLKTEEE